MFGIILKMFMGLLISLVNASNHTECLLLSNWKSMIYPILINFHPNKYSQEFHCYPFDVKLDRCVGSCNTLNDLSNKVCVPNEKNKWFKPKRVQHDCMNKFNKPYIMQM